MKYILPLASALLFASTVSSQVTTAGETASDVGSQIQQGTNNQTDSESKGTKFTRGLGTSASIRGAGGASTRASIGSSRDRRTGKTSYFASVSNRGSLFSRSNDNKSSANTTGDGGKAGAHTIQFKMSASSDTKGKLTIFVGGNASRSDASASAKITIGTKTVEWKSGERNKSESMDVTLNSTGVTVTVESAGAAKLEGSGSRGYSSFASVRFTPDDSSSGKCTITKDKDGCGPELAGTASTSRRGHLITLNLTKAVKDGFGINVFASKGDTFMLQMCPILANVVSLGAFRTNSDGASRHFVRLSDRSNLTLWTQDITLSFDASGLKVASSNTLKIECKTE